MIVHSIHPQSLFNLFQLLALSASVKFISYTQFQFISGLCSQFVSVSVCHPMCHFQFSLFTNCLSVTSVCGTGIAQLVVCWARCPAWCKVAGSTLLWSSRRGNFSIAVNMGFDSIPYKSFRWECKSFRWEFGARRGATVSTSAFLACQCYSASASLAWGLNFRALVCGISEAHHQGFSLGTPVSSLPSSVNGSGNKIRLK